MANIKCRLIRIYQTMPELNTINNLSRREAFWNRYIGYLPTCHILVTSPYLLRVCSMLSGHAVYVLREATFSSKADSINDRGHIIIIAVFIFVDSAASHSTLPWYHGPEECPTVGRSIQVGFVYSQTESRNSNEDFYCEHCKFLI